MADHFYSKTTVNLEVQDDAKITVGTATAGAATLEVRVPDGQNLNRRQVVIALQHIADYIATNPSVPVIT